MLHFEGDKDFAQAPAALWPRLSDIHFLAQCVPDAESVTHPEADVAQCVIRPGFSFARGTLELTMRVADRVEGASARLLFETKGIGTTSKVEAAFNLAAEGSGSKLRWTADVKELGGLLKAVPQGLLRAAAQKVIADSWAALEEKLKQAGP
jgi:carbon monoxide dehydrogenase subunit G